MLRRWVARWWPGFLLLGLVVLFLGPLSLTNRILAGLDVFTYTYPYRQYAAEVLRQGGIPLWNPYLFMGVPFLANPQAGVLYPLNLLLTPLDAPEAVKATIVLHLVLASVFAYAWARVSFRFGRAAALVTGVTFGLGGFLGAQVEHVNQLSISAWLPLELLLVDLSLPGRWGDASERCSGGPWPARAALAAVLGISFLAGHTQAWYICAAAVGLYAILPGLWAGARSLKGRISGREAALATGKGLLLAAGAVLAGLGLAAAQLLPTLELARLSVRSEGLPYREAVSFSLRPGLLFHSLFPTYGEDLSHVFASPAWTEYVGYVGVLGWLLALVALVGSRRRPALITGLTFSALGLFLALGGYNPIYLLLYYVVPGFGSFRVPARWLVWFAVGMALLAGAGLEAVGPRLAGEVRGRLLALECVWRRARAWKWLVAGLLAAALALVLWLEDLPACQTWLGWGLAFALGAALLLLGQRRPGCLRWSKGIAVVLVTLELFAASRMLPYNWPTAREAFSSLRTAPAFLLTDQSLHRFLSLSDIRYDPGDLPETQQIFADQLPERAIYDYVVATKEKEILAPNLPLLFHVPSVDGYDGGVLPLRRYVSFQRLFLPEEMILPDGRLREQLRAVPSSRLLNLVGVKYVITDKVQDVWVDGFYYDLEHTARLSATTPEIAARPLPRFPTSALGLVSHLVGAAQVPDGTPVAEVIATDEGGREHRWTLRAGVDTAEGQGPAAHRPGRAVHAWRDNPEGQDYLVVLPLDEVGVLTSLRVRTLLGAAGEFHLRGVSLLNTPTKTSESLILSTAGHFRLAHSGDVKIYENLDYLPRAYLVHKTRVEPDDEKALSALEEAAFDPGREAILGGGRAISWPGVGADQVVMRRYAPEEVVLETSSKEPGYLVLADSWYPGWEATVDGQPARVERANMLFRAVYLPAGEHTVRMWYQPRTWAWGWKISALVALALGVAALGRRRRGGARRKREGGV